MTPLHAAVPAANYDSHNEIIELLIAKGAIVNTKNIDDETPLDGAIRQKKQKSPTCYSSTVLKVVQKIPFM